MSFQASTRSDPERKPDNMAALDPDVAAIHRRMDRVVSTAHARLDWAQFELPADAGLWQRMAHALNNLKRYGSFVHPVVKRMRD